MGNTQQSDKHLLQMFDAIPLYARKEAFEGKFGDHNDSVLPNAIRISTQGQEKKVSYPEPKMRM